MIFAFFLGLVVGLVLGVVSVAKTALWERKQAIEQLRREGFFEACAQMGIAPLELLRQARQHHT